MKDSKRGGAFKKGAPFFYSILFIIPLVFFLVLEMGLRMADYGENLELFVPAGKEYPEYLKANRLVGLRYFKKEDKPLFPNMDYFKKEKPQNCYRIFMLGGSSAKGWPYGANMMPSRPLAKRLGETFPDRHIEMINVAFSAVNTYTLLDFVGEILEQSPDAVLIYAGHNEFYGALGIGSSKTVGGNRWLVNLYLKLQRFKSFMLLKETIAKAKELFSSKSGEKSGVSLMRKMARETNIPYDSALYRHGLEQFEGNMREIIEKFKSAGVKVVISELVSNLKDRPPFVSIDSENNNNAQAVYNAALKLEQEGRFDEARLAYTKAKDLDALRFRAPESFNEIIDMLGDEYGLPVVPMKRYFEEASPNGLIGSNLIMEHLHPNSKGYFLMSEAFFDTMRQAGMIAKEWPTFPSAGEFRRRWGITEFDEVLARMRIMELTDYWPFKPADQAGSSFGRFWPGSKMEALAWDVMFERKNIIKAHYIIAKDYESKGELDAALREYDAMIDIYPYFSDIYKEAAELALKLKRPEKAVEILREAVKIKPDPGLVERMSNIGFRR